MFRTFLLCVVAFVWASLLAPERFCDAAAPEEVQFFETEIRPLLAGRCFQCHGDEKQKGDLRLDSLSAMLGGGESGPAIEPGEPAASLLIEAVQYESFEMPPDEQLAPEEITALSKWIRIGAPWPGADRDTASRAASEKITEEDLAFWSFQPPRAVEPPDVRDNGWSRNEIDRFVFRRLQAAGLSASPPADRRVLIRRLYFDLIGLPPQPADVAAFVNDPSPTAYDELVGRLLKSPRYGERFARGWLDLVRYAESDGYKQDGFRPHAWRYRDYVIRALNEDKPYDQFVLEQLAGDEIAPHDLDALAATSYLRHWIYEYNQRDVRTQWDNILNDITDVTGEVFLAMGMGCARCHDHKFDPILREDYYRLQAFFAPLVPRDDVPFADARQWAEYQQQLAAWETKTAELRAQLAAIERPQRERAADGAIDKFPRDIRPMMRKEIAQRTPFEHQLAELAFRQVNEEYKKLNFESKLKGEEKEKWLQLRKQLAEFDSEKPKPLPPAFTVGDVGAQAPVTYLPAKRGKQEVRPGFLTVIQPGDARIDPAVAASNSTGRRTALARWIVSPDNPLTARVIVNRVWQHHFGRGIVGTASDFGQLGERPTHPELLDWLAVRFVDSGWRLKELHRLIVTSATYRQSAVQGNSELARLDDPENRLLWKMPVRRLEAEQVRDAMLAVTGELDLTMGSPSVETSQPRRSIYTKVVRNRRDPLLSAFDAPDGFSSASERNVTTTPTQALLMMNGSWSLDRAEAFARSLHGQGFDSDFQLVDRAFQLAYGRPPTQPQREAAVAFLQARPRAAEPPGSPLAGDALPPFPVRGGQAASIDPDQGQHPLVVPDHPSLPAGDLTIEACFVLRSLYEDATVRTIVSQWDSDSVHPGWSFGVTSQKSSYQPRNLILQLVGDPARGGAGYEVVASNLRPELNRPYYAAVSVELGETGEQGVTFYLQDLSDPQAPLQTAQAPHRVTSAYRSSQPLVIGGRATAERHCWHGLIDDVRISTAALTADQLLIQAAADSDHTVARWQFDLRDDPAADASRQGNRITATLATFAAARDPRLDSLVDFCHVLLNSSEFVYVD